MPLDRRRFLQETAAGLSLASLGSVRRANAADSPANRIHVAVIGNGGRGTELAKRFSSMPDTVVTTVCDVDQMRVAKAASAVNEVAGTAPQTVDDLRRILDDKSIDVIVVATPDHWHGPATILGCTSGKHVYCEKPACHNPREGELMIEAAQKHDRVVQLGTQRRSSPGIREAIEKVQSGAIGDVHLARCWYNSPRPALGKMQLGAPPATLDYALWQGPAPERPYREFPAMAKEPFHYNWHWFWHWGTAELGNNGVHTIDVCRWGLGVENPTRITCSGGRYAYKDDQETPDTTMVTFDFGDKAIVWEGESWQQRPSNEREYEMAFYGTEGTLGISGGGYKLFDKKGQLVSKTSGSVGDIEHIKNFLAAVRGQEKLNQPIESGYQSTLLCLLGNISYRTGRTLTLDPQTHKIAGDAEAMHLWSREYRPGWEPKV